MATIWMVSVNGLDGETFPCVSPLVAMDLAALLMEERGGGFGLEMEEPEYRLYTDGFYEIAVYVENVVDRGFVERRLKLGYRIGGEQ